MTIKTQDLVVMLMVAEAMILLVMILRIRRRTSQLRRSGRREGGADIARLAGELESLIRQVDRRMTARIAELEQLVSRAAAGTADAPRSQAHPPGAAEWQALTAPQGSDEHLRDEAPDDTSLRAEIAGLADEGLNSIEIAARVERPIGEIELLLRLRHTSVADR